MKQGKKEKALELYEESYKKRKEILGDDDDEKTLLTLNNIACLYKKTGDEIKSLELYKELYSKLKAKFGENHKKTLKIKGIIESIQNNKET